MSNVTCGIQKVAEAAATLLLENKPRDLARPREVTVAMEAAPASKVRSPDVELKVFKARPSDFSARPQVDSCKALLQSPALKRNIFGARRDDACSIYSLSTEHSSGGNVTASSSILDSGFVTAYDMDMDKSYSPPPTTPRTSWREYVNYLMCITSGTMLAAMFIYFIFAATR